MIVLFITSLVFLGRSGLGVKSSVLTHLLWSSNIFLVAQMSGCILQYADQ